MSEMSRSISNDAKATGRPGKGGSPRRAAGWIVALTSAAAAAVALGILLPRQSGGEDVAQLPRARVERGPMTVSITEDGEVKAEQQQVISNELRWRAVIAELFPEGQIIRKGVTAIRLECQELIEAIEEQEIRAQSAENDYRAAVTNYDIKKLDLDARVAKAGYAVEDAKANLAKYREAEWNQLQAEATSAIDLAAGDLKLAEHKLTSKQKINSDPELNQPYSQSEIDAERLTVARLKRSLQRAQTDRNILLRYTHPRRLRNLQTSVEDAERELKAAEAERRKQLNLAETQKKTKELQRNNARKKLADLIEDRDTRLDIKAEQAGLVVYETRKRPWQRPITVAVKEEIAPRQQLMIIPDSSTLVVKTRVFESVRERVSAGLAARIRLDARAAETLHGTVEKVAYLPDSQNPWLSPGVKVYPTTITFNDDVTGLDLKPGMTCDVVITLAELDDVLSVPIAAVFPDQDETFCYVVTPAGTAERRKVTLGMTSETRAEIQSGLEDGQTVLLVPPPSEGIRRRRSAETPASRPAARALPAGPAQQANGQTPAGRNRPSDGKPDRRRRTSRSPGVAKGQGGRK